MGYKIKLKYLLGVNLVKIKGKNKILSQGILKKNRIKLSGENNILEIEEGARLNQCNFWIKGKNNLVKIGKNCDLNNLTIVMENKNGIIDIGDETTCGATQIVSLEPYEIKIGKNCMISYGVEIRNTDSHKIFDQETNEWLNVGKEVIIGDQVWIASKVTILKGSKIGEGSVIGTGSIVNRELNKNSLNVGVPTKEIKKGIYWNKDSVIPK